MKVLLVNTSDHYGGAARAAYRLHRALIKIGVDSRMLVQHKIGDDNTVIGPKSGSGSYLAGLRSTLDRLPVKFYRRTGGGLFFPAWLPMSGMLDRINDFQADLVHLHWICGGMLRIEDIAGIKAPLAWTLHDMWPFTGGCHYDEGCGGYKKQCDHCRVLGGNSINGLSSRTFMRKLNTFPKKEKLCVVGLSRWLSDAAAGSTLFADRLVVNLPNPIDTDVFRPRDKFLTRERLGLPKDKKLLAFGVMKGLHDPRKGAKELNTALSTLERDDLELVIFGNHLSNKPQNFPYRAHYLGELRNDDALSLVYSSADVVAIPSRQENLSNIIMESLACGAPVVAFRIGGNSDMIDHQSNGYLADPFDPVDLARGIDWILDHADPSALCVNARQKVLESFTPSNVAAQYIRLYEKILAS